MVDAQGGGAVAPPFMQAHQEAIRLFAEGISLAELSGVLHGCFVIAGLGQQIGQLVQQLYITLIEPFPLGQQPVIITARQQFAAIAIGRLPEQLADPGAIRRFISLRDKVFVCQHIEPKFSGALPAQGGIGANQLMFDGRAVTA
jgi:hypothetical protein